MKHFHGVCTRYSSISYTLNNSRIYMDSPVRYGDPYFLYGRSPNYRSSARHNVYPWLNSKHSWRQRRRQYPIQPRYGRWSFSAPSQASDEPQLTHPQATNPHSKPRSSTTISQGANTNPSSARARSSINITTPGPRAFRETVIPAPSNRG